MGDFLKNLIKRLNQPLAINASRWSALGILLALIAILYWLVAMPLMGLYLGYRENIDDLQFRLSRLQKVASEKNGLQDNLEKLKSLGRGDESFFPTQAASLASAALQTQIKQAVTEAGGELTSTQVVPERNEEQFSRIGVKVRMSGSTPILKDVLYHFESTKPFLFVENLNIRPIRMPRNPAAKNKPMPDRLSIDFDVVGYMRSP